MKKTLILPIAFICTVSFANENQQPYDTMTKEEILNSQIEFYEGLEFEAGPFGESTENQKKNIKKRIYELKQLKTEDYGIVPEFAPTNHIVTRKDFKEQCEFFNNYPRTVLQEAVQGLGTYQMVTRNVALKCDSEELKDASEVYNTFADSYANLIQSCEIDDFQLYLDNLYQSTDDFVFDHTTITLRRSVGLSKEQKSEMKESDIARRYHHIRSNELEKGYILRDEYITCDQIRNY